MRIGKPPVRRSFPESEVVRARNQSEAEERFTRSMNEALGHLTKASQWRAARPGDKSGPWSLVLLPQDPIPFACGLGASLYFGGGVRFEFERDQRPPHEGGWKVVVREYIYSLRLGPEERDELFGFHWHPSVADRPDPHVHVGAAHQDLAVLNFHDLHVPTARVFFEDVLLFAVRDLTARNRDGDDTSALRSLRDRTRRWVGWR